MKHFFNALSVALAVVGGWLALFLGPMDGLLITLFVFVVLDYVTGMLSAGINHRLSSAVGFKGIAKKVFIFVIVGVANLIDVYILKGGYSVLRTAVIFFYLGNEGISILENAGECGLPIPSKIRQLLEQLKDKGDKGDTDTEDLTNGNNDK